MYSVTKELQYIIIEDVVKVTKNLIIQIFNFILTDNIFLDDTYFNEEFGKGVKVIMSIIAYTFVKKKYIIL